MKKLYLSFLIVLLTNVLFAQNQPPVLVTDSIEAVSQLPILIDVLANDYDPDGDSIYLVSASSYDGEAYVENGKVVFVPSFDLGLAKIRYIVSDGINTASGYVLTTIIINPDAPV